MDWQGKSIIQPMCPNVLYFKDHETETELNTPFEIWPSSHFEHLGNIILSKTTHFPWKCFIKTCLKRRLTIQRFFLLQKIFHFKVLCCVLYSKSISINFLEVVHKITKITLSNYRLPLGNEERRKQNMLIMNLQQFSVAIAT